MAPVFSKKQDSLSTNNLIKTSPNLEVYENKLLNYMRVNYNGETTSTIDNRTYYLANGRWPSDSSVVVLVNGSIVRGGYFTNREMGTVTFTKELNFTDIVTVFVLPSNKFRVGVKISKYTNSTVDYQKFGLTYTSVANKEVELDFLSSPSPTIYPDSLSLLPSPAISTERIYIDYDFVSEENNKELNSRTEWYRRRGGGSFLRVNASNSLPNYDNRTVEKLSDINSKIPQKFDIILKEINSQRLKNQHLNDFRKTKRGKLKKTCLFLLKKLRR